VIKERARELIWLTVIFDAYLSLSSYFIARFFFPHGPSAIGLSFRVESLAVLFVISLSLFCLYINHTYESMRVKTFRRILAENTMASLQTFGIVVALIFFYKIKTMSRGFVIVYFGCFFFSVLMRRLLQIQFLRRFRRKGRNTVSVLVVGASESARRFIKMLDLHKGFGFRVIGLLAPAASVEGPGGARRMKVPVIGTFRDLDHILKTNVVDKVVFACRDEEVSWGELMGYLEICEEYGVRTAMISRFANTRYSQMSLENLGRMNLVTYTAKNTPLHATMAKRALDATLSALALLVFLPVLAVVAVAIRLESPGPVFFRQKRSGLNGRIFEVLKFRTMCTDAEHRKEKLKAQNEMSGPVFKIKRDPRITKVGRLLRKYSLDELPQLVNVLKGEMSLVGPRPLPTYEMENVERRHRRRLSVKPGLTCLWQVSGRNNIDFEDWMDLDMQYINNWSLRMDFMLMLKTFSAVLKGTGM
jgi:exopolysaccharide biosynthesis polyprenyl glycosylphosphotransferase